MKITNACLFLGLLAAHACAAAPAITLSTPSQTVTATYVQVNGTVTGAAKPMWYEVHGGSATGPMIDYGAFPQNANWFFQTRHLAAGNNTVVVFAADASNNITTASLTLTIDTSGQPAIRPRPAPVEIWWGGLGNNSQLQQNPSQWMTVKKYADAYFFHTAAWGSSNNGLMQNLVQQEAPYGTKFVAELGGSTGTDTGWPQWEFNAWGAGGGFISDRYTNTGLILTEATHDFHNNWPDFANAYPTWSETQINDFISNSWAQYFQLNNTVYPHLKQAITNSPVWWGWNSFPSLNPNTESDQFTANGRSYSFSMAQLMQDFRTKTAAQTGHTQWSFYSDFPWYTMVWGENSATATGLTGTQGWTCREKVRNYELWLHQNSARHTAVCNEDISTQAETDLAGANANFYDKSLKSIYLNQREGHRPNQFLLESWYTYSGGALPTNVTPEDATNSYTGLTKSAIKYLKGIKDVNGTLETLSLTQTTSGNTTTLTLTNTGDFVCMPALAAIETGDGTITTQWFDSAHNDISSVIRSAEGWVDTAMLNPGQSVTITSVATTPAGSSSKQVQLEAFWNPQDPTGIVRSRQTWKLGQASLANGIYEIVAKTTGNVLDCTGCSNANGTLIELWSPWGGNCQQWSISSNGNGNGTYSIRTINSDGSIGRSLDCSGASPNNGTQIELWDFNGGPWQQWILTQQPDGYYSISTAQAKSDGTRDVLDGQGCSGAAGANVLLWSWGGGGCQQEWSFTSLSSSASTAARKTP